jgi:hypothetical protein
MRFQSSLSTLQIQVLGGTYSTLRTLSVILQKLISTTLPSKTQPSIYLSSNLLLYYLEQQFLLHLSHWLGLLQLFSTLSSNSPESLFFALSRTYWLDCDTLILSSHITSIIMAPPKKPADNHGDKDKDNPSRKRRHSRSSDTGGLAQLPRTGPSVGAVQKTSTQFKPPAPSKQPLNQTPRASRPPTGLGNMMNSAPAAFPRGMKDLLKAPSKLPSPTPRPVVASGSNPPARKATVPTPTPVSKSAAIKDLLNSPSSSPSELPTYVQRREHKPRARATLFLEQSPQPLLRDLASYKSALAVGRPRHVESSCCSRTPSAISGSCL